jgi:arsenite-transporting ATPase
VVILLVAEMSGGHMKFLQNIPPYLFFTGKGGVGKTSISCATAISLAEQGRRVLLVSTDPASNVGQVFSQTIGNTILPVASVPGLSALEIDPQAAAQEYRARIVDPIKGILPDEVVNSINEQLSGACTTEIAAFDEFTGLLTDASLLTRFDHIIFDTAPTGHTIRLLQLPGAWSSFIESNPDGASCLGPMAGLEKQREQYSHAVQALSDPDRTRLVLVARLQKSTLQEVARTHDELAAIGLKNQYLVINGVLPETEAVNDTLAAAIWGREQEALASLPAGLDALPTDTLFLQPVNMVGVSALRGLITSQPETASFAEVSALQKPAISSLSALVDEIALNEHGLIMLMGKGGVGKTTMAAAIAVRLAEMGFDVHLTTSDPAAHLSTTLNGSLNNLQVSRIDPHDETERYRQHVLETKGRDLDEAGKHLLEEDLRSPCTEEIAVFQAFSRVIREAGKRFVVMDTAPTGHTLLLLDATGAYHREIAKKMGDKGHFSTPMMQLQDPERTKVLLVTLPETTPVLEAANLQADLERAGIHPWGWIINNSLSIAETRSPLLRQRAQQELPQIEAVKNQHATRVALVPVLAAEPTGIDKLKQLAG